MLRLTITVLVLVTAALGRPGRLSNKPGGRIVGGEDTDIADYPFQLSLQYYNFHFCGAVILTPTWAVTAGHCIVDMGNLPLEIRAGSTTTSSGGQLIRVTRTVLHPQYDDYNIDFDIGLIELEEAITVENASPIALPGIISPLEPGAIAAVTGWGIDDVVDVTFPDILQVVEVPVISQNDCINAYLGRYYVSDNMFCAGFLGEGGKDSCNGDSGGPVVVNNVLAGLVSWGGSGEVYPSCAEPLYPGVYTNVHVFVDWINEHIS